MDQIEFNETFRRRTKNLMIQVFRYYGKLEKSDEIRIAGKQLLRSVSSVAANFRAVCRGRSLAERFSKMCIVVEEADETLFWIELFEELISPSEQLGKIKSEATEILKVMATCKNRMKKYKSR